MTEIHKGHAMQCLCRWIKRDSWHSCADSEFIAVATHSRRGALHSRTTNFAVFAPGVGAPK